MNKVKILVSIVAALLMLTLTGPAVFAAETGVSTGTFTASNVAPTVSSVVLWDTEGTPATATAMTPQTEYDVRVAVTDNNTLNDLTTITVTIYYDTDGTYDTGDRPGTGNVQTCSIITWTQSSDTFDMDATSEGGSWSLGTGVSPTLTDSTGTFQFKFTPGKVAKESAGSDEWHIYAVATDGATGDAYQEDLNMNWYGEISSVTASVGWGSVALGVTEDACDSAVSATYTSNGAYDEKVKSGATWVNGGNTVALDTDTSPGAGQFALKADDDNTTADSVQVLTTYVAIDEAGTITGESGVADADNTLWLWLGSSSILDLEYTGTLTFQIANGS